MTFRRASLAFWNDLMFITLLLAMLQLAMAQDGEPAAASFLPLHCQDYIYSVDFMGPQRTILAGKVPHASHCHCVPLLDRFNPVVELMRCTKPLVAQSANG
jgi:hypothetical protein